MISEQSAGRGVSAWLLAIDSSAHFAFCDFYHKQNGFGFGSQSALRPVSLRSKKWGRVVLIKQKLPIICFMCINPIFSIIY